MCRNVRRSYMAKVAPAIATVNSDAGWFRLECETDLIVGCHVASCHVSVATEPAAGRAMRAGTGGWTSAGGESCCIAIAFSQREVKACVRTRRLLPLITQAAFAV